VKTRTRLADRWPVLCGAVGQEDTPSRRNAPISALQFWPANFSVAEVGAVGRAASGQQARACTHETAIGDSDLIISALAPFADSSRTSPEVREVP
jgi:hypothetical protein